MAKNRAKKKKTFPEKLPRGGQPKAADQVFDFLTKASTIYLTMTAIGLLIMRYGHKNLTQVLPWPPIQASPDDPQVLSGILSLMPSLVEYGDIAVATTFAVFCILLCATAMIILAFLFYDFLRPIETAAKAGQNQKSYEFPEGDDLRFDIQGDNPFAGIVSKLSPFQLVLLAFLTALGEEILFRGSLQPYLGLFAGSVLYGIVHLGPGGLLNPLNLLGFIRGLFLGWIFLSTHNLWICIGAEFLYNLYALLDSKKQVSSRPSVTLKKQPHPGDL